MAKYEVGSVVQLKKPHACGANEWTVRRTGIDIKLLCSGCGQTLWMKRPDFERHLRRIRQEDGRFVSPLHLPDRHAGQEPDGSL